MCRAPLYESTFVTFQGRPYMLWASGLQGWTVPGMRRVRYYLTSYKLALPDITRVPPATNIALRRRLAGSRVYYSSVVQWGLVITCMAHLGTRTRPVTDHTDRYLTVTDRYIAYLPIPPIPSLPEPVL